MKKEFDEELLNEIESDEDLLDEDDDEDNDEDEINIQGYQNKRENKKSSITIILIVYSLITTLITGVLGFTVMSNTGKLSKDEINSLKKAEDILNIMYKTDIDNVDSISERLKDKFITSEFYKVDTSVTNIVDRYAPFTNKDNDLKFYYKTTYAVKGGYTVLLGYRVVRGEISSVVKEVHIHFNKDGLIDEFNEYDLLDAVNY